MWKVLPRLKGRQNMYDGKSSRSGLLFEQFRGRVYQWIQSITILQSYFWSTSGTKIWAVLFMGKSFQLNLAINCKSVTTLRMIKVLLGWADFVKTLKKLFRMLENRENDWNSSIMHFIVFWGLFGGFWEEGRLTDGDFYWSDCMWSEMFVLQSSINTFYWD